MGGVCAGMVSMACASSMQVGYIYLCNREHWDIVKPRSLSWSDLCVTSPDVDTGISSFEVPLQEVFVLDPLSSR